jgi:hypothetical protein
MTKKNLKPNNFKKFIDKTTLLNTGSFLDNNFLEKYLSIFEEPLNDSQKLESHHILPKAYFNMTNQKIDRSPLNLRTITFKNHYLAHYYLYNCTTGLLKKHMAKQFSRLNLKISMVSFDIMSQIYEVIRDNDRQNYVNFIKTAHNNINEYNKKFKKRPKNHVDKIQESKRLKKLS